MTMKEFIDDFKSMVKTHDTTVFKQKYIEPAKVAVDTYTPIIVESTKKAWNKGFETFQKMSKKAKEEEAQVKADIENNITQAKTNTEQTGFPENRTTTTTTNSEESNTTTEDSTTSNSNSNNKKP